MKRNAYLLTVFVGLALALGVVGGARAQDGGPVSQEGVGVQAALGTGFTYQGQLKSSGSPVSDTCIFGFGLWDSASGGVQLGVTQTVTTTVANGLFTATLNDSGQFGGSAFSGSNARYLGIGVKCGNESNLTNLGRQVLNASPYALYARNNWGLNGNSTSVSNILGTTNNMTLTLAVSNTAALRLVPNATSPNLIGGYSGNSVTSGAYGATIGGGGASGFTNIVSGTFGTISGGLSNTVSSPNATVGGGFVNTAGGAAATVGGGFNNTASSNSATISGGESNDAIADHTTVGGGNNNSASGDAATVGGGSYNTANGFYTTVGGGDMNTASGLYATVSGGQFNAADGQKATIGGGGVNTANGEYATVGGGYSNIADEYAVTVSGGYSNTASGQYATAGGGYINTASGIGAFVGGGGYDGSTFGSNQAVGNASTIGGGLGNTVPVTGTRATIGGGSGNTASGFAATVGGGHASTASGNYATVGGGLGNAPSGNYATISGGAGGSASGNYATISGGTSNSAGGTYAMVGGGFGNEASGQYAMAPGGEHNLAQGIASFAAGQYARALHDGAFVWADATVANPITSTTTNQFLVRASGGITLYTNSGAGAGVRLTPGSGTWASLSDRNIKANFASVDGLDILEQLMAVPIQTWNYQTQDASIRHIGPMAQDFYAAFNVGEDNTHITTIDADGVALAAIQGLYQVVQEKDAQLGTLRNENTNQQQQIDQLQQQNADLQTRVAALEQRSEPPIAIQSPPTPLPWGWLLFGGLLLVNLGFLFGRVWSATKGTQA